jgi:diphthamide biosynthesis protein 2
LALFILADTSYGSCCVDEVAAQHASCDLIVHYGFSCLSRTRRLPVRYVFGRAAMDCERFANTLLDDSGWTPAATDDSSSFSFSAPPPSAAASIAAAELPPVMMLVLYSLEYAHLVSSGALPRAIERALAQRTDADKHRQFIVAVARVDTEHGQDGMAAPALPAAAKPATASCASGGCACKGAAAAAATEPSSSCACASASSSGSSCCSRPAGAVTATAVSAAPPTTSSTSAPSLPPLLFASSHGSGTASASAAVTGALRPFVLNGFRFSLPSALVSDAASFHQVQVVWIGPSAEHRLLANAMLNYNAHAFHLYNPSTFRLRRDVRTSSRTLARRFFLMEKAKSASIVGILVGTLGVANYLTVLRELQAALRSAGKKSYLFVVGKLNEPKLSNFAEIDLFVLVACPLASLFDGRQIGAAGGLATDVVTPFEMMMAVRGEQWTGDYDTTFDSVLRNVGVDPNASTTAEGTDVETTTSFAAPASVPSDDPLLRNDREAGVRFDPISGKIKAALPSPLPSGSSAAANSDGALIVVQGEQQLVRAGNGELVSVSSARDHFLSSRSFQGLLVHQSGERGDEIAPIEQGLDGMARHYRTMDATTGDKTNAPQKPATAADAPAQ